MSDTEAILELARAVKHIDEAVKESESEDINFVCVGAFDDVTQALNDCIDHIDHECEFEEVEITRKTEIE